LIDEDEPHGSVQSKTRPCVVVQNDKANRFSEVTIVVVATTKIKDKKYPCDVIITDGSCGLEVPSRVMCNQIFTVSIDDLGKKIGELNEIIMKEVDDAIKNALGLS
jgi:mRNA interferase MazF